MESIKKSISFSKELEKIVKILDENLLPYVNILVESEKRRDIGWAYNKLTLDNYRYNEAEELKEHKKKLSLLDDLTQLGYIDLAEGHLYNEEGVIKDTYSIYTISQKGKELLKNLKQNLGE